MTAPAAPRAGARPRAAAPRAAGARGPLGRAVGGAALAANLALLVLWPLSWHAPLLRTSLLPFLEGTAITLRSTVAALWPDDPALAALVALFGMVLPYAKTVALIALQLGRLPARARPLLEGLGRLAMADVFLIALAIVAVKGAGLGRIETAPGLALFAGCVLLSLAAALAARPPAPRPAGDARGEDPDPAAPAHGAAR